MQAQDDHIPFMQQIFLDTLNGLNTSIEQMFLGPSAQAEQDFQVALKEHMLIQHMHFPSTFLKVAEVDLRSGLILAAWYAETVLSAKQCPVVVRHMRAVVICPCGRVHLAQVLQREADDAEQEAQQTLQIAEEHLMHLACAVLRFQEQIAQVLPDVSHKQGNNHMNSQSQAWS